MALKFYSNCLINNKIRYGGVARYYQCKDDCRYKKDPKKSWKQAHPAPEGKNGKKTVDDRAADVKYFTLSTQVKLARKKKKMVEWHFSDNVTLADERQHGLASGVFRYGNMYKINEGTARGRSTARRVVTYDKGLSKLYIPLMSQATAIGIPAGTINEITTGINFDNYNKGMAWRFYRKFRKP